LNVLAGAATCLVVYLIGAGIFDRRVGLVGALILALFPSQIFGTTLILTEVFWTFVIMSFLLAVMHFTLRPGPWWQYALVGMALGVISLIRGETLPSRWR
jgi:4-amino-4-deoxy-L-arabinose transferase-like glycosyltransferase